MQVAELLRKDLRRRFRVLYEKAMRYREMVRKAMFEVLSESDSVLFEAAKHLIKAGGKLVRPVLFLLACEFVGGDPEKLVFAAAGAEFGHVASLIHDDIIDGDEVRRGVPAVHVKYGVPMAILAGDLLIFKAFQMLALTAERGVPPDKIVRALKISTESSVAVDEGEAMDVLMGDKVDVSLKEYFRMIELKTAEAFRVGLLLGALLGGGTEEEMEALSRYGLLIGIAFQIQDDILGVFGSEEIVGKPVADVLKGRRNFLIVHALEKGPEHLRERLRELLSSSNIGEEELEEIRSILIEAGSLDEARRLVEELTEEAKKAIEGLGRPEARQALMEMADFLKTRVY
ncbi:polyprenyl synthetase family protein [Candidatus Bathyarchaeota archaeon]|nr:MAG: polyprenyl synthetase family protein [Candidatus Bathyarchaeota archaeon]